MQGLVTGIVVYYLSGFVIPSPQQEPAGAASAAGAQLATRLDSIVTSLAAVAEQEATLLESLASQHPEVMRAMASIASAARESPPDRASAPAPVLDAAAEERWIQALPAHLRAQLDGRSSTERASRRTTDGRALIGIGLGTTTRGLQNPILHTIPLFQHMLPSLPATADPSFEYLVYVVYDADDPYFADASNMRQAVEWLQAHVEQPMAAKGIQCQVLLIKYDNNIHKPGPAFNFVMRALYEDGAEYLVRVNDDTELKNSNERTWSRAMVDTLTQLNPPNVGVAGPSCHEGAAWILTHDMVHRTHLDIFPTYYPPVFTDWWLDDWITNAYGKTRTRRLTDIVVTHHAKYQRYPVAEHHGHSVHKEVEAAQRLVGKFVDALASGALQRGDVVHQFPQPAGSRARVMAFTETGVVPAPQALA